MIEANIEGQPGEVEHLIVALLLGCEWINGDGEREGGEREEEEEEEKERLEAAPHSLH